MKRTFLTLVFSLVILSSCQYGSGFSYTYTPSGNIDQTGYGEWLFLIYMDGDNNLEEEALNDINEMESVDWVDHDTTVLVLIDRAESYSSADGDWTQTRLYKITKGPTASIDSEELKVDWKSLKVPSEINMGEPEVLSSFVEYGLNNYPSSHNALILWNHGNGWRNIKTELEHQYRSICQDNESGDILYTSELGDALGNFKLDIIGFDLCTAAMLEIYYEIRGRADYIIGSEEEEPAAGWSYDELFTDFLASDRNPYDFCTTAVDTYKKEYETNSLPCTLSVVDASEIEIVNGCLNEFSRALENKIIDGESIASHLLNEAESFYGLPGDCNLDLLSLAETVRDDYDLIDDEADNLAQAVKKAVPYSWADERRHADAGGLSLHYTYLDSSGNASGPIEEAYYRDASVSYPLDFISQTLWAADREERTGLLYSFWY